MSPVTADDVDLAVRLAVGILDAVPWLRPNRHTLRP